MTDIACIRNELILLESLYDLLIVLNLMSIMIRLVINHRHWLVTIYGKMIPTTDHWNILCLVQSCACDMETITSLVLILLVLLHLVKSYLYGMNWESFANTCFQMFLTALFFLTFGYSVVWGKSTPVPFDDWYEGKSTQQSSACFMLFNNNLTVHDFRLRQGYKAVHKSLQ